MSGIEWDHSSITDASASVPKRVTRQSWNAAELTNLPNAQTAAPRTSGEASSSSRSASAAKAGSPELPIA
jgi:hypothetical protein